MNEISRSERKSVLLSGCFAKTWSKGLNLLPRAPVERDFAQLA